MDEKNITCIICPIGCKIFVKTDGKQIAIIEGDICKKGIDYAKSEALDPRRMLTTSVLVKDGESPLVSIKSNRPVPKDKLFPILRQIKKITINAPVVSGQIIIKNVLNSGVDIVATKTIKKQSIN
jgi:CxxC motif-containing protein